MAQARVRLPADQRAALVDRVEPENHPHRGRLAGAVRPDEPGHAPGRDREREAVEGDRLPEPLAAARLTSIVASMPETLSGEAAVLSSRRRAIFPIAGLSYEGRTASLSGGTPGSLCRGMPNGRPAATMVHVVGVENWRRGRSDHQAMDHAGRDRSPVDLRSARPARGRRVDRRAPHSTGVSGQRALALCVVALATTLPPAFAGRTAAAAAVVAASVVSLTLFHTLTVAALVAQLAVLYPRRSPAPADRAPGHADRGIPVGPFLVLALAHPVPSGSEAAVLAAPRLAGAGGRVRGDRATSTAEASSHDAARQAAAGDLLEHVARGERARDRARAARRRRAPHLDGRGTGRDGPPHHPRHARRRRATALGDRRHRPRRAHRDAPAARRAARGRRRSRRPTARAPARPRAAQRAARRSARRLRCPARA